MRLHVRDEGPRDAPAVLLLHGLFGSISNLKGLARRLSAHWRTISVDLRNHGASPWHDDVSYAAMAGDVGELMDDLDLADAVVAGHSMGGKTAMTLALDAPVRVRGLAVIDIAPVAYGHGHGHEGLIDALLGVDLAAVERRADLDRLLATAIPDPVLRGFLGQNLVLDDGRYRWRIHLAALRSGMPRLTGWPEHGEARYPGEAVFVHGGASDYVDEAGKRAIARHFPAARLVRVDGAGHWLHAEQPAAVAEAIHALAEAADDPA